MAVVAEKTCGECHFWHTPKCRYAAEKASLKKSDSACLDFYQRSGSDKKKQRRICKDSGLAAAGSFEAIYHNGKPAFLTWNGKVFSTTESIEINEQSFSPKEARQTPYEPYSYFEGEIPNREDLFWKVRSEFQTFIDVESIWKDTSCFCSPELSAGETPDSSLHLSLWRQRKRKIHCSATAKIPLLPASLWRHDPSSRYLRVPGRL